MFNRTLSIATLALLAGGSTAAAAPQTAHIEVGELTCAACGTIAGRAIDRVDTVSITGARLSEDGTVAVFTIRYDDAATTPGTVATAVTEGVGYPARVFDE